MIEDQNKWPPSFPKVFLTILFCVDLPPNTLTTLTSSELPGLQNMEQQLISKEKPWVCEDICCKSSYIQTFKVKILTLKDVLG